MGDLFGEHTYNRNNNINNSNDMTTGQRQVPTAQPQGTVAAARQGTVAQQGTVAAQPASQNNTAMKRMQEETVNSVLDRVNVMQESGELVLPRDYNAGNALKSAWLYLQTIEDSQYVKVTDKCTRESICNCLGIPDGYNAFATRGYADRQEYLKKEIQIAREISGKDTPSMIVYGGGEKIKELCVQNNILYVEQFMANRVKKGGKNG